MTDAAEGEVEREPQLKFEQLASDVPGLLASERSTCLRLSEKILALGTDKGRVHLLDYSGNQVRCLQLHSGRVNGLSFDQNEEHLASCSNDFSVVVANLYTDSRTKHDFKKPITALAIDPQYSSRRTKEILTGGLGGQVLLSSQGWLGRSDSTLHTGADRILAAQWNGHLIAWATERCAWVYDASLHQHVGNTLRPPGGSHEGSAQCSLLFGQNSQLYVSWPDCIKVARITSMENNVGGIAHGLEVVVELRTQYYVLGVSPFGQDLAVLSYPALPKEQPSPLTPGRLGPRPWPPSPPSPTLTPVGSRAPAAASGPLSSTSSSGYGSSNGGSSVGGGGAKAPTAAAAAPAAAGGSGGSSAGSSAGGGARAPAGATAAVPGGGGGEGGSGGSSSTQLPSDAQPAPSVLTTAGTAAALSSASAAAPSAGTLTPSAAVVDGSSVGSSTSYGPPGVSHAAAPTANTLTATAHGTAPSTGPVNGPPAAAAVSPASIKASHSIAEAAAMSAAATRPTAAAAVAAKPADALTIGNAVAARRRAAGSSGGSSMPPLQQQPPMRVVMGQKPELRIMSLTGYEYRPPDVLPLTGHEQYSASDYSFVPSLPATDTGALPVTARGVGTSFATAAAAAAVAAWNASTGGGGSGTSATASGAATPRGGGSVGGGGRGEPLSAAAVAAAAAAKSTGRTEGGSVQGDAGAGAAADAAAAAAAKQRHRWDEGQAEFMYFVVAPQDILIARTRDANDRVAWLLAHRQFEDALAIAEGDKSVLPTAYEQVVQGYIDDLLTREAYDTAAQLSRRLLKDNAVLWERWVYLFAQTRQLPKLAPYIPISAPRLRSTAYEMVLSSLLLHPSDHGSLLALVQSWPSTLYSMPSLVDAVAARMKRPGGDTEPLWQLLAWLYQQQGRPDLSLSIYLQLRWPAVFPFITQHSLYSSLVGRAAALIDIDEAAAVTMLTQHADVVPPSSVVPGFQEAMHAAATGGNGVPPDPELSELWRRRLHQYLQALFEVDATVGAEYHGLQVGLYAQYQPSKLTDFLVSSQYYSLEDAHRICEEKGLVPEQVFIQGRMGNAGKALALIIEKLADIPQAIEFVRGQHDEELWGKLIDWALGSSETTGSLLDHIGGFIDPLLLIQRIPKGMKIPQLRDRLRTIIADFRTQTSLREGCNVILRSDCTHLIQRLYRDVRHGLTSFYVVRPDSNSQGSAAAGALTTAKAGSNTGNSTGPAWYKCNGMIMTPVQASDVPSFGPLQSSAVDPPSSAALSGSGGVMGATAGALTGAAVGGQSGFASVGFGGVSTAFTGNRRPMGGAAAGATAAASGGSSSSSGNGLANSASGLTAAGGFARVGFKAEGAALQMGLLGEGLSQLGNSGSGASNSGMSGDARRGGGGSKRGPGGRRKVAGGHYPGVAGTQVLLPSLLTQY